MKDNEINEIREDGSKGEARQAKLRHKEEIIRLKSHRVESKGKAIASKNSPRVEESVLNKNDREDLSDIPPVEEIEEAPIAEDSASVDSLESLDLIETEPALEGDAPKESFNEESNYGTAPKFSETETEKPLPTPQENAKNSASKKRSPSGVLITIMSLMLILAIFTCISSTLFMGIKSITVIPTSSGVLSAIVDRVLDFMGIDLLEDSYDSVEAVNTAMDSVVLIVINGKGAGSGVIISSNGYIVTNYHVVSDTHSIYVNLRGSSENLKAELIGYSKHDDIAVLKINKDGLRPATLLDDCSYCLAGEPVYAIGAPEGSNYSWSVTRGIISSPNRYVKIYKNGSELTKKMRMIQTDAALNRGNSGGALINSKGQVIGIVTMRLDSYIKNNEVYNIDGIGFALPSDGVIPLVEAIIEKGNTDGVKSTISSGRPMIGITCTTVKKGVWFTDAGGKLQEVSEEYAKGHPGEVFFTQESGVLIRSTVEGQGADGKLLYGDIITHVDGSRIYSADALTDYINELHGGNTVTVTVARNGESVSISITLTEAPIE